jgi:hypothetical protein
VRDLTDAGDAAAHLGPSGQRHAQAVAAPRVRLLGDVQLDLHDPPRRAGVEHLDTVGQHLADRRLPSADPARPRQEDHSAEFDLPGLVETLRPLPILDGGGRARRELLVDDARIEPERHKVGLELLDVEPVLNTLLQCAVRGRRAVHQQHRLSVHPVERAAAAHDRTRTGGAGQRGGASAAPAAAVRGTARSAALPARASA